MTQTNPRTGTPTAVERQRAKRPSVVARESISVVRYSDGSVRHEHNRLSPGSKRIVTTLLHPYVAGWDCDEPNAHHLMEAAFTWLQQSHPDGEPLY